ncbi:MAG TPA: deoxyribonuclease IV [Pirellulaceae bacterium]|jgi:deoxyribonuclease-4|nr:deoxyribonuclease IV [Pirellulaceae bacterium]
MLMVILGAHMSIAGGFHKAVERAATVDCDCVQMFTAAPQKWPVQASKTNVQPAGLNAKVNNESRTTDITDDDVVKFHKTLDDLRIAHPLSHASYLINLASPDKALWTKSVNGLIVELQRAEKFDIPFVVVHPGSYTTSSEEEGIEQIALALNTIHEQTSDIRAQCLLENTAGQGTNLGWRFEHLAAILDGVVQQDRVGICFDTCHAFAAGYPLTTSHEFTATFSELDRLIGIEQIHAIHLNDSKREFGSRVDRHENLGEGCLGLEPFRHLVNDRRLCDVPMYLETPKGKNPAGDDWDQVNLATLRALTA